jgi:hypothetical protein
MENEIRVRTRAKDSRLELQTYGLPTLATHLQLAGDILHLHELINNNWMGFRLAHDGHYGGFLDDVAIAWQATLSDTGSQFAYQLRYALIRSSIQSLARRVPATLYPVFIEHGLWALPEAVGFAQQISSPQERCEVLIRISETPGLTDADRRFLVGEVLRSEWHYERDGGTERLMRTLAPHLFPDQFNEALESARRIDSPRLAQSALSALAAYIPMPERDTIIREAQMLANTFEAPGERARALANMAPVLSEASISEALDQIALCAYDHDAFTSLQMIAGYVPASLHGKAISIIKLLPEHLRQVIVLVAFATQQSLRWNTLLEPYGLQPIPDEFAPPALPSELHDEELAEALQLAHSITNPHNKASALLAVATGLQSIQEEALDQAVAEGRKYILGGMDHFAAFATPRLVDRLIESIGEFANEGDRSDIIRGIAPHLSQDQVSRVFSLVEPLVRHAQILPLKGRILSCLPSNLRKPWLQPIYEDATKIGDRHLREATIRRLLTQGTVIHAQRPGTNSQDFPVDSRSFVAEVLANRASHRPETPYRWSYSWTKVIPMGEVILGSKGQELQEVFDLLIGETDRSAGPHIAYLLGRIAQNAEPDLLARILYFVLTRLSADQDTETYSYCFTLADIARCLSPSLLMEAVAGIQQMSDSNRRACAAVALAPYLHMDLARGLVNGSFANYERNPAMTDAHVPRYLVDPDYEQAITLIREIPVQHTLSIALVSIAPYISIEHVHNVMPEVLDAALTRSSWTGIFEQHVLLRLISIAQPEMYQQLIFVLDNSPIMGSDTKTMALYLLMHRILSAKREAVLKQWPALLESIAARPRDEFLHYLHILAPAIAVLCDSATLKQIVAHIIEVSDWWR